MFVQKEEKSKAEEPTKVAEIDRLEEIAQEIVRKIVQEYLLGAVAVEQNSEKMEKRLLAVGVALWAFGMSVGLNLFLIFWGN